MHLLQFLQLVEMQCILTYQTIRYTYLQDQVPLWCQMRAQMDQVEYLVVAGGGGGGGRLAPTPGAFPVLNSAGGGAGGLRTGTLTVTATTYPITVGNGGPAGPCSVTNKWN